MEEMNKLERYLFFHKYNFERFIEYSIKDKEIVLSRNQIIVYENNERKWDAICHQGSYGYEKGLIEIMGTIVIQDYDEVEGNLTAGDIIKRLEGGT